VLPGALPHPNVLGGQPEHGNEREACVRAVPHALDHLVWPG